MRLSTTGISILRGNKLLKEKVAKKLGVSMPTMYRYVSDNDENLTKAASLLEMREFTGLTDHELLDFEKKGNRSNGHKHTIGN